MCGRSANLSDLGPLPVAYPREVRRQTTICWSRRLSRPKWQLSLGYMGADADGILGQTSLTKLGLKHGWKVGRLSVGPEV